MDLVFARGRDCTCPGTPHPEGDGAFLIPKPDLALGFAAEQDINLAKGDALDLQRRWVVTYVRHGAKGWNLTDEKGQPVPFDVDEILSDYSFARDIADKGDELYGEAVMRPLLRRLNGTSRGGRTGGSTSRSGSSIGKQRGSSSPKPSAVTEPLIA